MKKKEILEIAQKMDIPVEILEKNTLKNIKDFLRRARKKQLKEVIIDYEKLEEIIQGVLKKGGNVELPPGNKTVRDEEQAFIARFGLNSEVIGLEPNRRVIIYSKKRKAR